MKWFTTTVFLMISSAAMAGNQFDHMEAFREIQRLIKVEDQKKPALELAKQLQEQLDKDDDLYKDVSLLVTQLGKGNPNFPLDKAIKFATGQKDEIFCKNVGLVFQEGRHNDGTISTLKLISSNRDLGGTYSQIKSGDWIYEFDSEYRDPVNSESWLDESTDHSYKMREFRRKENGRFDDGKWSVSWYGTGYSSSTSTHGESFEPLPMYMANDYAMWGTYDMGFKIKFEVGYKDQVKDRQNGSSKIIVLATDREVIEKLPKYSYQDAAGGFHEYPDCFKVRSDIKLDKLEN